MKMILDYNQIDPLLLPALENFPPLDITRDNLSAVREMLAQMPSSPKPEGVIESKATISTDSSELDIYI